MSTAVKVLWEGIYPAMLTPFTANDEIDFDMFKTNMEAQIAAGIDGVILCGTLGEASTLSNSEKLELLKFVKREAPEGFPVIINIAEQSTREAVAYAQQCYAAGADGFMLLPPMRYRASDEEVVTYFTTIAQATPLPIMLYNNPVDYGIKITLEMFEQLQQCATIEAVKESTRDLTNITRMINRFGKRFKILGGVDTIYLESLLAGADGAVAGLVDAFPAETVAIYKLAKVGRIEEALKIYRWFMPLLELDIHPKLVQYIKLAATAEGISSEYVRAPRLVLKGDEREAVLKIINDAIATRPVLPQNI